MLEKQIDDLKRQQSFSDIKIAKLDELIALQKECLIVRSDIFNIGERLLKEIAEFKRSIK